MIKFLSDANTKQNQEIFLFYIPPKAIKQLILGAHMKEEARNEIINKISENKELNHLKIYQAILDENKYGLKFKDIRRSC